MKGDLTHPDNAEPTANRALTDRVKNAGMHPQLDYTTGEVARILRISRETVRQMILRWEPPGTPGRNPSSLFAIKLGCHRRIPHRSLVEWYGTNTAYLRDLMD